MKMATLVVEALSIAPNMMPYNADVELTAPKFGGNRKTYVSIDRFSADSRVNKNGDCEDQAREILNQAYSLQCGTYSTLLVRTAQFVCRCYLALQQFGAVELGNDPSLAVYSTGGRLFAHSFVVFVPAVYALASMEGVTLEDYMCADHESGVETLTTDGIALFDPKPMKPDHACISTKLKSLQVFQNNAPVSLANKLKSYSAIGNHYYVYLCSAFVLNGLLNAHGVPVYELYYSNCQNSYGCKFAELIDKSPTVKLIPTYEMTKEEQALAMKCTAVFHPVPPYTHERSNEAAQKFEEFKNALDTHGAILVSAQPEKFSKKVTVFVNTNEVQDPSFAATLGHHLKGLQTQLTFESLADDMYGAQLNFYTA
jgi:hypothetical protein